MPRLVPRLGRPRRLFVLLPALCATLSGCGGCTCDPPPPEPVAEQAPSYDPDWWASRDPARKLKHRSLPEPEKRKIHARPMASVAPSLDDPLLGRWTLDQATSGLGPGSEIVALISTTLGPLRCNLWPDKAPVTVANFVGLARGLRPWKTPAGAWEKRPAFDGTMFFRVLTGFVVQGGSPTGERDGGPGYVVPDEIWEDANHDRAGLLCMANLGRDKGGMQFFVTAAPALHLDGSFTIFGECGPLDLVQRMAAVEVDHTRPTRDIVIQSVRIERPTAAAPPAGHP